MSGKPQIGSGFEDFLAQEGTRERTNAVALKRVIAWQLRQAMQQQQISKNEMAKAMRTSRSQLDRILDPENDRVQMNTLARAAEVLGYELRVELV